MKIALDFLCDVFYYDATLFLIWRWIGVGTPVGATTPIKLLTRFYGGVYGPNPFSASKGQRTLSFHQPLFDKTFNQYFTRHIHPQVQRQAPNAGKGLGSKVCTIQELLGHTDLNMTMIYAHVVNKGCSGRKARRTCYKHAKKLCAGSPGHQKSGRWNQQ